MDTADSVIAVINVDLCLNDIIFVTIIAENEETQQNHTHG